MCSKRVMLRWAVGVMAADLLMPLPAHASIFFEDNYKPPCSTAQLGQGTGEACNLVGSSGGVNPPANMSISTTFAVSGTQSLKFHYVGTDSGGFIDRNFGQSTNHLFIRFMYRPVGMGFHPVGTQVLHAGNAGGATPNFLVMATPGSGNIWLSWQLTADGSNNHFQNQTITAAPNDQWSCIEVEAKMNTPGVANGEMRLWINGVLTLQYTDKLLQSSGQNMQFNFVRFFVQHSTTVADTFYDLVAAGNTRIGCPGAPADTTPPSG